MKNISKKVWIPSIIAIIIVLLGAIILVNHHHRMTTGDGVPDVTVNASKVNDMVNIVNKPTKKNVLDIKFTQKPVLYHSQLGDIVSQTVDIPKNVSTDVSVNVDGHVYKITSVKKQSTNIERSFAVKPPKNAVTIRFIISTKDATYTQPVHNIKDLRQHTLDYKRYSTHHSIF